ncbi:hypothetical protein CHH28_04055 [Bacterioplanes sanyensis]|uniref:Lipoprotein n=1 Tax=Bacterioplanes sanyensis TaxID=1249553 RepID=A0A222FFY0_9GAMM|nr:hypothetical protein [Bacterioplanes sanyensis]ASP37898.1 hypothetical protein CHH28_04055 [Bacterioplanes sanyensis]
MKKPAMAIGLALALSACGGSSSSSSDGDPAVESQPATPDTSGGGGTSSPAPGADGELKNHDQVLFNTSHTAQLEGKQLTLKYLPEPGQGALAIIQSDDADMTLSVSSANSATDTGFVEALKKLKNPKQRWVYIPEDRVAEVEFTVESSQENSEFFFTLAKPSRSLLNMNESDFLLHIDGSKKGECNGQGPTHWQVIEQIVFNFSDGYRIDNSGNKRQLTKIGENLYVEDVVIDFKYKDALSTNQQLPKEVEVAYLYNDKENQVLVVGGERDFEHQGQRCTVLYNNDKHVYPIVELDD